MPTSGPEDGATTSGPEDQAPEAGCENCISGRGILLALGFAMFVAYVAADFATGGRLTTAALGTLAALRGRGEDG